MRDAASFAIATVLLAFLGATGAARAGEDGPDDSSRQSRLERFCSEAKLPTGQHLAERLTGHLDLRDAQKQALKDLRAAFVKSMADGHTALCSGKLDVSTVLGRLAFAEKRMDVKLQGLRAIEPKLQAFYNVLDDKQKVAFNEMHLWHRHSHHDRGDKDGRPGRDRDHDEDGGDH